MIKTNLQRCRAWLEIGGRFSRVYHHPVSYFALLSLSYLILLALSYGLGYLRGSSLGAHHLSLLVHGRLATRCADEVPPELVRHTIVNRVYSGSSPYHSFIRPSMISSSLLEKRINEQGEYGKFYQRLVQKVKPKTVIKLNGCSGGSATYLVNLTRELGLTTQILCLDDLHGNPGDRDLFIWNVKSENAAESILPLPILINGLDKLCRLGIKGDLIEVDVGWDLYSAWSNINRAYKLLRPGGVIFGHNNDVGPVLKLFAQLNRYRFEVDGEHWMIKLP